MDRSPCRHKPTISALNSGVNERRRRGFFPMLSMIGHPSGGEPLMVGVRQSGSAPGRELRAVQDASMFARFARRWVMTTGRRLSEPVVLEAKLCGIGILDRAGEVEASG
jgi:hypothetical protein